VHNYIVVTFYNIDDKRQPWPNADKKSDPQLLRGPKLLSFGPTLFKY